MHIQRIESRGLAHYSYFVSDGIEAVVVDPRRDIDVYLRLLRCHRVTLKAILETHRHEDFVSGGTELSRATGAPVLHGAGVPWEYGDEVADGHELTVGRARLHAMATPGHTVESVSWVLFEGGNRAPFGVFTGDVLLPGAVGRVDLYGFKRAEANARELYRSLHGRILPLGDGVSVFPCHGQGSVCGVNIADRPVTTIGYERQVNPLLSLPEERFVARKCAEPHLVPPYFLRMERWNLHGPPPMARLPVPRALSPAQVEAALGGGARVLDLRPPQEFAAGHVPGALSMWLHGLPAWGGWALPEERDLVLVLSDDTDPADAAAALVRLGVDRIAGMLAPGWEAWVEEGRPWETLPVLTPGELGRRRANGWDPVVLDVRRPEEWEQGVLPGARMLFLGDIPARHAELPRDRPIVVTCSSGPRASLAASLLRAAGHAEVWNLLGGMSAAKALGWNLPRPEPASIRHVLEEAPPTHVRTRVLETV